MLRAKYHGVEELGLYMSVAVERENALEIRNRGLGTPSRWGDETSVMHDGPGPEINAAEVLLGL